MSKSKKAGKPGESIPFHSLPYDDDFLSFLTPMSPNTIKRWMKTFCRMRRAGEQFNDYWDPDTTAVPLMYILGPKGIGKSSVVKEFALEEEMELRRVMTEGGAEDLLPTVDPLAAEYDDTAKNDSYNRYRASKSLPIGEAPQSENGGILLADDFGQLKPAGQRVYRMWITEAWNTGIHGMTFGPRWNWVATGNPETASYFLVHELEESLRDRIIPFLMKCDPEDVIYYLSKKRLIPDITHKFLLLNKGHVEMATPRAWEYIGQLTFRHLAERALTMKEFVNGLRGKLPPGTVDTFNKYLERGDDPDAYPMLTREIVNAKDDEHGRHVDRMRKWARSGEDSLIAATGYDMTSVIGDTGQKFDDKQFRNLAEVLEQIPKTDLVHVVLDAATGTGKSPGLIKHIKRREIAEALANMQDRHTKHQREAGM